MSTGERNDAVVIWKEVLRAIYFYMPVGVRDEALTQLLQEETAKAETAEERVKQGLGLEATYYDAFANRTDAERTCDRLRRHIAEAKSAAAQILIRAVRNGHSPEVAARILFRQHRMGGGSGWLAHYLDGLPGVAIDRAEHAISGTDETSLLKYKFDQGANP